MNTMTKTFVFERETKGAVRYAEVDNNGNIIADYNEYAIGTLYIRKTALNGGEVPSSVTVTLNFSE